MSGEGRAARLSCLFAMIRAAAHVSIFDDAPASGKRRVKNHANAQESAGAHAQ